MTRYVLTALHAALGVAAIGTGTAFVRDPSGATVGTKAEWLEGSPFPDYRIPGLFLAVVVGGANLVSAAALVRRRPLAPYISLATGILLVVWIAVQTAIIGLRHWSQAIWWVTFTLVAFLGARLAADARRTPRGN